MPSEDVDEILPECQDGFDPGNESTIKQEYISKT